MLKWLVGTLKNEKDHLSEYSLEYATALLMNLSLKNKGKLKFEKMIKETL